MKTVGRRLRERADDPLACYRRAAALRRQMDKLNPFPRPRGFVFKARTRADYEAWRAAQENPRLR